MLFNDLITLAKAGFTPADVREFLKEKDPEASSASESATEKAVTTDLVTEPEPEKQKDPIPEKESQNVTPEPEQVDYKKQYEEAVEALKKAQAANTRQQLPEEDSGKIFAEAVAAFM